MFRDSTTPAGGDACRFGKGRAKTQSDDVKAESEALRWRTVPGLPTAPCRCCRILKEHQLLPCLTTGGRSALGAPTGRGARG